MNKSEFWRLLLTSLLFSVSFFACDDGDDDAAEEDGGLGNYIACNPECDSKHSCDYTTGKCKPKNEIDGGPDGGSTDGEDVGPDGEVTDSDVDAEDGDVVDADTDVDAEDGSSTDADADADAGDGEVEEELNRKCEVTLQFESNAQTYIAGEFNSWSETETPMTSIGGGKWSITLTEQDMPNRRGQVVAYKFVSGGEWKLDPNQILMKMVGSEFNSAFRFPPCELPEVQMSEIQSEWTGSGGTYATTVKVLRGVGGEAIEELNFDLDGEPIQPAQKDGETVYQLSGTALPGRHVLTVEATDTAGHKSEKVTSVFWIEEKPFDWRDMTLYMFMLDRFANGDSSNDAPSDSSAYSVAYNVDWHGGDLAGALAVLKSGYFEKLGVNAIWLSPVNKQVEHAINEYGDGYRVGYHGYWPIRAREIESRYGSKEDLKAFIDEAHRRGIRVLFDLIINHVHEEHEDYLAHPDWFFKGCICSDDPSCDWNNHALTCSFKPFTPDIDWLKEEAAAKYTSDALYWIEEYGIDGYRLDAVKHVEISAIYGMRDAIHRQFEQGGTRMYLVGEIAVGPGAQWGHGGLYYADGYKWIEGYTSEHTLDGQFDYNTYNSVGYNLLKGDIDFAKLETAFAQIDVEHRYKASSIHVSFMGNHDTTRMATYADCMDDYLYERLKIAWTVLMSSPYPPLIYYGDEVALTGNNDPDNRKDMLWTGDLAQYAMGHDTPNVKQQELLEWIQTLAKIRRDHPVLRHGTRQQLWFNADYYVYTWYDGEDAVVFAYNKTGGDTELDVNITPVGWTVRSAETLLGQATATVSGTNMHTSVPARSASVLLLKK